MPPESRPNRPRRRGLRPGGPLGAPGALAAAVLLVAASLVLAAVTDITYNTELNQNDGHTIAMGRNLPGADFTVQCDNTPGQLFLFNQLGVRNANPPVSFGDGLVGLHSFACGVDQAIDPASNQQLLFEGRTQIITQAEDSDNVPVLGPDTFQMGTDAGEMIFFDTDTGPPEHPVLDTVDTAAFMSTNGAIVRDLPNRVVTFNAAAAGQPLDLTVQGRVVNAPVGGGTPLGEVGATVAALIARQGGGMVPAPPTGVQTFTGPFQVPYAVNALPDPTNPMFDGVPDETGAFNLRMDFTTSTDGVYDLTFFTRDIVGAEPDPPDGNLTMRVVVDRAGPVVEIRDPEDPFIVNQPGVCRGSPVFTLSGQVSDNLTGTATVDLEAHFNDPGAVNPVQADSLETTTQPFFGAFMQDYDLTMVPGSLAPGTADQDLFVITAAATDEAGNPGAMIDFTAIIWDQAPTEPPTLSFPPAGFTTNLNALPVTGAVSNIRASPDEVLEEHGAVLFFLTVVDAGDPTRRTTFPIGGDPAATTHDSALDTVVAPTFPVLPPDFLGQITDAFTFDTTLDLTGFADGNYLLELQTSDAGCNISAASTTPICLGRGGPAITLDRGASGPDDNYHDPEGGLARLPNTFGADATGTAANNPVFVVSLRSPERPDLGLPPFPMPPFENPFPPFPNDFDPGTADRLTVAGTAVDFCAGVVEVRATGPRIPTTSVTFSPPQTMTNFLIDTIDLTGLPEGATERIDIVATNAFGVTGVTTSVLVRRDVIPGRAPRILSPAQPFFTAADTFDMTGTVGGLEAGATVALILPPTTGTAVAPIPRTTNSLSGGPVPAVPDTRSLFNSIPVFARTTVADINGDFAFLGVPLDTVAAALGSPTTLLVQTIDTFDNTDPVRSVTPFDVFRTTGVGNVAAVVLDPGTLREIELVPGPPMIPPTAGQFRGAEAVDIRVVFDTVVTLPPAVVLTQAGGANPVTAGLVDPADPSDLMTNTLTFRYPVFDRVADFDGPATLDIFGGRDVFGNDLAGVTVGGAFEVDTVAPTLAVTAVPTIPAEGQRFAVPVPLIQAAFEDVPAMSATSASGFSTAASSIELFGPLELNPDSPIAVVLVPPTPGFSIAATPSVPLPRDGTYRVRFTAVDAVGNRAEVIRTLVLDRTPVSAPSISHDPPCGSAVSVLPSFVGTPAITAVISDPTIDLAASSITVLNSTGGTIPTSADFLPPATLAAIFDPPLPLDGTADDRYTVLIDLVDRAGNPTPQVTCPFTLDTEPPAVALPSVANGGCVNDPFRVLQVTLADPPSLNTTSFFSAGIDRDASRVELRLATPFFPNPTAPGTTLDTKLSYRTVASQATAAALLEFVDDTGATRSLAADGREDGVYRVESFAADRAGNAVTLVTTFGYDTQEPRLTALEFPDPSSLAGATVTAMGELVDLGPCGFTPAAPGGGTTLAADVVELRVVARDALGRPVLPPAAPFYDFIPAAAVTALTTGISTGISARATFVAAGPIPMAPGVPALIQLRVTDRAGNVSVTDRRIEIGDPGGLAPPVLVAPPDATVLDDKVVEFRWDPVRFARSYELELTRQTPSALTTSAVFPLAFPADQALVDLDTLAASVPGGSPMTAASVFSWRLRGLDGSGNAGVFTPPTTFTFDPNSPEAVALFINGDDSSAGGTMTATSNVLAFGFAEETALDPAVSPQVFIRFRDAEAPMPLGLATVVDPLVAAISLDVARLRDLFRFSRPGLDFNGLATVTIRGARDLAGNLAPSRDFLVKVDIGPFIDLRLAPNPVDPLELLFAFVARDFEGGPAESVLTTGDAGPTVLARQQGAREFTAVSVRALPNTTPPTSSFHGVYRVSPNLLGFVDFAVEAVDLAGFRGVRTFSVAAAPAALLKEGINFRAVTSRFGLEVAPGSLAADATLFAVPGELADGPPTPPGGELRPVEEIGAFLAGRAELGARATLRGEVDPAAAGAYAPGQLGIYRADAGGWTYLATAIDGARMAAFTGRLGRFAVMADVRGPRAAAGEDAGAVALTDGGSGVDPTRVVFHGLASGPVAGVYDPATGLAHPDPAVRVRAGRRFVEVAAADRAGNETVTRLAMTVGGAPRILEAVAVPNPVRVAPARIRYRLDRPGAGAKVTLYDTAGRRLAVLPGPANAGVNEVRWDLRARRGRATNGVYFFRLEVTGGGGAARAEGKIAVIR